jgi:acetyl coenzyme A synthetase (ADP forming)-like protein
MVWGHKILLFTAIFKILSYLLYSMNLDCFIKPRSIAVVGASRDPKKMGHIILKHLIESKTKIYPVNPKAKEIEGLRCYSNVTDIPNQLDLVVLVVPAKQTPQAVKDCCKKGVRGIIPIAGGFSETGEKGRGLEEQIKSSIKGKKTRLLGPNTLGVYVPRSNLDTMFLVKERAPRPKEGSLALISQSGATGAALMDYMKFYGLGLAAFIGLGNRADLDESQFVSYFAKDKKTHAIVLYLETFSNGKRFLEVCREVSRQKPIVCLKAGRTERGARAASLHTGALAGKDTVVNGVFKQAGVIRAWDEEELLDYGEVLAFSKPIYGRKIAIVTCGGGVGVISADYLISTVKGVGLELAEFSKATKEELRKVVVPFASVENPVDLTGNATNEMYGKSLEITQKDKGVDGILCLLLSQIPYTDERVVKIVQRVVKHSKKPIVFTTVGGKVVQEWQIKLIRAGIPAYPSTLRAIKAIRVLVDRGDYLRNFA